MGIWAEMKTTLEITDPLYRRIKARTALRGETVKDFVNRAVKKELAADQRSRGAQAHWLDALPPLSKKAAAEIGALFKDPGFRKIDAEMWR